MKEKNLKQPVSKCFNVVKILILLLFSFGTINAQETPKLNVTVKLKIKNGDLKNSLISVTKAGAPFKVIDPNTEEDNLELPLGFEYTLSFTKIGYTTKNVIIDTHVPQNREKGKFAKQIIPIELEKASGKQSGSNSQPSNKMEYSTAINDFDFGKNIAKADDTHKTEQPVSDVKTQHISAPLPPARLNRVPPSKKQPETQPVESVVKKTVTGKNKKDVRVIQQDTKKTTIITITSDGKDVVYKKEQFSWGGVFYYKDGVNITQQIFEQETE